MVEARSARGETKRPEPASFLRNLRKILTDEDPRVISWDADGRITIGDPLALSNDVLNKYFRHKQFSSFQRQLNYFGYYKISGKGKLERCIYTNDALPTDADGEPGVSAPPYSIDALLNLKRKSTTTARPVVLGVPRDEHDDDSAATPPIVRTTSSPRVGRPRDDIAQPKRPRSEPLDVASRLSVDDVFDCERCSRCVSLFSQGRNRSTRPLSWMIWTTSSRVSAGFVRCVTSEQAITTSSSTMPTTTSRRPPTRVCPRAP